jgi:YccS/YhfK family integral membrane protein
MNQHTRRLHYFFFGQNFADGVRTAVAILLPAALGAQWEQLAAGITISTGAVCVSVADTPGPALHKRNGMLAAWGFTVAVALLTGVVAPHKWLLGLEVGALSFAFTMLLVWGARAAAVGTAALLCMVLTLATPPVLADVLRHAGLLALGGLWYQLLAAVLYQVRPYWPAQQALGDCLHAIARFLDMKAAFYEARTDLDDDYRRLVQQQIVVNEKQEAARDLLFRTRQIVSESTSISRRLVLTFVEAVDLYEHITASYYDYANLRETFGPSGILDEVAAHIRHVAAEVDHLGAAIQAGRPYGGYSPDLPAELTRLQARMAELDQDAALAGRTRVLRKILVNLRDITRRLTNLRRYFDESQLPDATPARTREHRRFVPRQDLEWKAFGQNLTLQSAVFRHAVRMTLACLVAFLIGETLWRGTHSYWILMTVTIMLKPGFSLTRQRNTERILGTLGGGLLGGIVLYLVPEPTLRFGLLVVFMVVAYSFQRTYYLVTVVFMTAYLLIMFSFLGLGYMGVIEERVLDTLMGSAIAFAAGYFLFPSWERDQLRDLMATTLRTNQAYLRQLAERLAGQPVPPVRYRLLRKEVYVASANLAAAFQRMLSEPKSKQRHPAEIHQFVVLNHILSSNIAAVTVSLNEAATPPSLSAESRRALTSAQAALGRSLNRLAAPPETVPAKPAEAPTAATPPEPLTDDRPLLEQLTFLQKVSGDIGRVTEVVSAEA